MSGAAMAVTIQAYEGSEPPKVAAAGRTGCGTVASQPSRGRPEWGPARREPAGRSPSEGIGERRTQRGRPCRAGRELLDLVERVRRTTIRLRRGDDPSLRAGLVSELAALAPERAEVVVRAFSLYFRLVNLAEERELVREGRRADRARQRATGRRATAAGG